MSQAIPTQHPAVVLRSHYTHLRILLAVAMIAIVSLTAAVVILAAKAGTPTSATPVAVGRGDSDALPVHDPPVPSLPNGRRYDGGPEEGTRGVVAAQAPSTRYDGGPEEGSRGPAR